MDGLQAYAGPPRNPGLHTHQVSSKPTKAPSEYLRAIKRRLWLVLAVAVPISILGAIWTARQPNIYSVKSQIMIEPPSFDPHLASLIAKDGSGKLSTESGKEYISNRIAILRSKSLAERVVNDPQLSQGNGAPADNPDDILGSLQTRPLTGTSQFTVTLEGTDPARITLELNILLELFQKDALAEIDRKIDGAKMWAQTSLASLESDLKKLEESVSEKLQKSETIGPSGKNLKEMEYEKYVSSAVRLHDQLTGLMNNSFLRESQDPRSQRDVSRREAMIEKLEEAREKNQTHMNQLKRRLRSFNSDPSVRHLSENLKEINTKLSKLKSMPIANNTTTDPYQVLADSTRAEIQKMEQAAQASLVAMRESLPEHQGFTNLTRQQESKIQQIATMQTRLWEFGMISQSRKEPVTIVAAPVEPGAPIRPKRAFNVALVIILSLLLGTGLVCFLEYLDHTVKYPEHLTAGLTLPLFGVVPRIRRSSLSQRGGHLWTSNSPDSIEADAYRNLRASLLGVTDRQGPLVSLLVTSAKAGEGKSTTALNLAATCARAGERTLLMDVDLRRPSLASVFQDDQENPMGLVDVLRGDLPWQRTVVRTDIPNLDFLPTGDTHDVPIEILGTLELRQLILGLTNHYDRVILDGPAVLGLADCRMLGRIVDGALLVVRSGAHELRPLQHAKTMLEQSHVNIAGLLFNGLKEDLKHWSSYGPDTPSGYTEAKLASRKLAPGGALDSSSDRYAALPMVGASES